MSLPSLPTAPSAIGRPYVYICRENKFTTAATQVLLTGLGSQGTLNAIQVPATAQIIFAITYGWGNTVATTAKECAIFIRLFGTGVLAEQQIALSGVGTTITTSGQGVAGGGGYIPVFINVVPGNTINIDGENAENACGETTLAVALGFV